MFSSIMGIANSDFIFSIKGNTLADAEQNLSIVVSALQKGGFQTQARPGSGSSVLVFARISAKTYAELLARDVEKSKEFGVTSKSDAAADRYRLIYSYLTSPRGSNESKGVGLTPGRGEWKSVDSIMANSAFLADKSVTQLGAKEVCSTSLNTAFFLKTYGTQVALYFEFLKFYILGLVVLSFFGVVAFVKSKTYSLTYTFVNLVYGVSFLLLWKRKERHLTNAWGVQNAHRIDELDAALAPASLRSTEKQTSAQSKGNRGRYRFLRELAFAPIALVFVAVLVTYQLSCFVLEIFLTEIYDGPGKLFLALVPTVLICGFVPVLAVVYNLVVDKFLNWEGHDNKNTRYDSFVVKTFTLNFLTGYIPLFITSFIYLPFAHFIQPELPVIQNLVAANIHHDCYAYKYLTKIKSQRDFTVNQTRLDGQVFYFIAINQIIQLTLRYMLPLVLPSTIKFVQTKLLGKKEEPVPVDKPEEKEWLSKVRTYIQLPEHNVHDDYRGLCLQFGYLSMFGPVWTLAPLVSLFFNVVTFKLDALKLTNGQYFRPPVPKRVDSTHPWDLAFLLLAWLGSIVSPAVTMFYHHGTKPPKHLGPFAMDKANVNVSSSTCFWLTLFASEHLFFFLMFLGSKASSFLRSDKEIENSTIQHMLWVERSEKSETSEKSRDAVDRSGDWEEFSIEEIKKQAKGTSESVSTEKGKLSGVAISAAESTGSQQNISNRKRKLAEFEEKKALLGLVKETLLKRQLEERKQTGDAIIETIGSDGKKTQAIIDGDQHIPMSDVEDVEKRLSQNKEKTVSDVEKDSELSKSEPQNSRESLDEKSTSNKPSKKKSLKDFLKRG